MLCGYVMSQSIYIMSSQGFVSKFAKSSNKPVFVAKSTTDDDDDDICISNASHDSVLAKKLKNAEAARRFRKKKKEKDRAMIDELRAKVSSLESQVEKFREEKKDYQLHKTEWTTHQSYYVNVLENLRMQFKKQKEYVGQLENMLRNGGARLPMQPSPFIMPPPPPFQNMSSYPIARPQNIPVPIPEMSTKFGLVCRF